MEGLTPGRIVHFVMPDGEHRPAIVVRVWWHRVGMVNLQVFTDGLNDGGQHATGLYWATSILLDEENKIPNTWHWIEPA